MKNLAPILTLLFTIQGFAAETPSPLPLGSWSDHDLDTAQRTAIRQAFQQGIDQQFIPGGSLMIIHKGEVILQEGFGVASLESGEPFAAGFSELSPLSDETSFLIENLQAVVAPIGDEESASFIDRQSVLTVSNSRVMHMKSASAITPARQVISRSTANAISNVIKQNPTLTTAPKAVQTK